MANSSVNNGDGPCFPMQSHLFLLYVRLPGVILHFLIVTVLIVKLKLRKQMHKFMLSLSVSDLVQMIASSITVLIVMTTSKNSTTKLCHNARNAVQFISSLTMTSSSGSIVGLSVERYISCIYCFRFHSILTKKRTLASIALIWCAGLICGLMNEILLADGNNVTNYKFDFTPKVYADAVIIFATSAGLILVQLRLFVLIQKKLRNPPGGAFPVAFQARSAFFRQLKINVALSAAVVAYLTCMLPMALLPFLKPNMSPSKFVRQKNIVMLLSWLNPVLNPFIYGIGMREIRNVMSSHFRAVTRKLLIKLLYNSEDFIHHAAK